MFKFPLEKVVYGWNFDGLKSAIRTTIASTYAGSIEISFECTSNKVYVRPDNRLSRTLSNPWLKFLMFITLVYPFIWLFKRFHPRGGGKWEVCGGAYALKRPVLRGEEENADSKLGLQDQGTTESSNVIGLKEGQWLRQWEDTIKRAATSHLRTLLTEPDPPDRVLLDGYVDQG
jgi:hypothetical protein